MSLYETALRMLNEQGEALTLTTQQSGGDIDPITGEKEAGTIQTETIYGTPVSNKFTVEKYFSGLTSEESVYMTDASQEIKPGHTITNGLGTYRVVEAKPLRPKGQNIYYMVKLVR